MATGTVQFQSATLASPPAALAVMADAVNHSTLGAGSAQYVKIMDGAVGGTAGASVTTNNGLAVDVTRVQGTTTTKEARAVTAPTTASQAATVGNVIVLAANPSRMGAAFYVEGGAAMYLKMGSNAGTVDYTVQVPPGGYYEMPFNYVGTVSAIWQAAGGTVRITEFL